MARSTITKEPRPVKQTLLPLKPTVPIISGSLVKDVVAAFREEDAREHVICVTVPIRIRGKGISHYLIPVKATAPKIDADSKRGIGRAIRFHGTIENPEIIGFTKKRVYGKYCIIDRKSGNAVGTLYQA